MRMKTLTSTTMTMTPDPIAGIDEATLELLRRERPSVYGQPTECCGSPESCAAACGDIEEVRHGS